LEEAEEWEDWKCATKDKIERNPKKKTKLAKKIKIKNKNQDPN
jgi:hypothetical protein